MASRSLPSLVVILSSTVFTTTDAAPVPLPFNILSAKVHTTHISTPHLLSRRGANSRQIGINLSITLSVIFCAALFFFLGMRRGKSGSWFCLPKTFSLPTFSLQHIKTWFSTRTWPWQKRTTPVFELDNTEKRKSRTPRRSWLWERMRAEQSPPMPSNNGPMSPYDVSPITPITPIVRSRDQIREARRVELERRGIVRKPTIIASKHEHRTTAQNLAVDLNVYEMGTSASPRPKPKPLNLAPNTAIPRPLGTPKSPKSPSRRLTRHSSKHSTRTGSKPPNWFLHWRFYFEQSSPNRTTAYLTDKPPPTPSIPSRWFSVKSHVTRSNTTKTTKTVGSRKMSVAEFISTPFTGTPQSRWSKSTTYSVYELDGEELPPAYPEQVYDGGEEGWGRLSHDKFNWHGAEGLKKEYEKRMSVWRQHG